MSWLVPVEQARLLCGALGGLAALSFACTKAAEVWRSRR